MIRLQALLVVPPWLPVIVIAIAVTVFPAIDLWASGLFFNFDKQNWMPRSNVMQFARSGVPPLIIGALLFTLALWGAGKLFSQQFWGISGRKAGYLLTTLVLGPGLVVESFLKVYSGRARPRDTTVFGGDDPFTPALWLSDACSRNCSFVSGHAALAFWVTAFAFLLPEPQRRPVFYGGMLLGALMGVARIAEGAHFLSDVIYAGLIVVGINICLAGLMLQPPDGEGAEDGA